MSTGSRIALTVGAGVLLGLATLVAEHDGFPTAGVNAAFDSLFVILVTIVFFMAPLVVSRWWVVFSMTGPALALLIMQAANIPVHLDDATGAAINYRTIFQFFVLCTVMLIVFGARSLFMVGQSDQPG